MKFPKLHLACSDDELRPQMEHICIEKEFTFASDAHILVRHKTEEIFDEYFFKSLPDHAILVHKNAVFLMCQKATLKIELSADKKLIQLFRKDRSIISFKIPDDLKYPNANSVIPDLKDIKPLKQIKFRYDFLHRLGDALGSDLQILKLSFISDSKSIHVTAAANDYESAIGLIMPVMMD